MRNEEEKRQFEVLVASADVARGKTLVTFLQQEGYAVDHVTDAAGVLRLAGRRDFDIIVLDLELSDGDVDLVSYIRQQSPATQLILLFEVTRVERAMDGIRQGAFFYLPRETNPSDISLVVNKAVRYIETGHAIDVFEQDLFEELVGATPAMRRVIEMIRKVAPTDSTVLLLGESGTGKEVLANALHRLSRRREMPFVAVNCAALPENLLESELFGHVKGAFTGAAGDKRGLFEEADQGTILLDEVGDIALVTQAKLLRVLQDGEIRRVGSSQSKRVNVRVIAATNRDLVEAVRNREFREDLYFRLNVFQIRIPPLRERMDALPSLVRHFLSRFANDFGKQVRDFDEHAWMYLRQYDYPGNVRELESIVAHAVIMAEDNVIHASDLPDQVRGGPSRLALPGRASDEVPSIAEMEADLIRRALATLDGNQTEAARKLGISRSTLWRKMKEYGIQR